MGHGYESTSVAEIRELLKGYGVDEETLQQTKKSLVELLIAYNTSGVKKEEIKIEKLYGEEEEVGEIADIQLDNINEEGVFEDSSQENDSQEDELDEEVEEEDYLDSLVETPYDISSFNDLEVEISEDNTINIEGLEDVLEQIKEERVEEEEDIPVTHTIDIQETPKMFDIGWVDFLMGQLTEKEMYQGYPKASALKRLLYKYVGPILKKELRSYVAPTTDNKSATISVLIRCFVTNKKHPAYKQEVEEESIADANVENNSAKPYIYHMSSIAERRAESRCYRNLLGIDVMSAEEATCSTKEGEQFTMDDVNNDNISQIQVIAIDLIAKRLNINVFDYINAGSSGKKYTKLTDINSSTASVMIQVLNDIASGKIARPENIGEYKDGWDKN
jgi:hypothetical protein